MIRTWMAALCAAGLAIFAQPSGAAIYLATYTGVVLRGFDETNEFGLGPDLANQTFVATYTYDTSSGAFLITDGSTYEHMQSGFQFGGGPIITQATFQLGAVTKTIIPVHYSAAYTDSRPLYGNGTGVAAHIAQDRVNQSFNSHDQFWDLYGDLDVPASLDQTYEADFFGAYTGGNYYFLSYDGLTDERHSAQAVLSPSHIKVERLSGGPAAIPEPATWAMMIGGFSMAGAALRRRRAIVLTRS